MRPGGRSWPINDYGAMFPQRAMVAGRKMTFNQRAGYPRGLDGCGYAGDGAGALSPYSRQVAFFFPFLASRASMASLMRMRAIAARGRSSFSAAASTAAINGGSRRTLTCPVLFSPLPIAKIYITIILASLPYLRYYIYH